MTSVTVVTKIPLASAGSARSRRMPTGFKTPARLAASMLPTTAMPTTSPSQALSCQSQLASPTNKSNGEAVDQANCGFTREQAAPGAAFHVAQGHGADHERECLNTGVAALSGDDGHVDGQHGGAGERVLKDGDRAGRHEGGGEVEREPGQAAADGCAHTGVEVLLLIQPHHAEHVLCGFLLGHVQEVVGGGGAHQAAFRNHHGNRAQVVVLEGSQDFFLVGLGGGGNDVGVHQVAEQLLGLGDNEVTQTDHALQGVVRIDDVEVVDVAGAGLHAAEVGDRVVRRHRGRKGHKVRRHDAAGGLIRVFEQRFNAIGFVHGVEHGGGAFVLQSVEHVGCDIGGGFIEGGGELPHRQLPGDLVNFGRGQVFQDGGDAFRVEVAEKQLPLLRAQFCQEVRLVGRVEAQEVVRGDGDVAGIQPGGNFPHGGLQRFTHAPVPPRSLI